MRIDRAFVPLFRLYWSSVAAYEKGNPVLPDSSFDVLEKFLFGSNPPPRRAPTPSDKRAVRHAYFVPSLQKVKNQDQVDAWVKRLPANTPMAFALSAKVDGVHLTLTYRDGVLVQAATRGDGTTGRLCTAHAKMLPLPQKLPRIFCGVVEGEVILKQAAYEASFAKDYTTARAAVAGMLNADVPTARLRQADFLAFELYDPDGYFRPHTHKPTQNLVGVGDYSYLQALKVLKRMGFETPYVLPLASTPKETKLADFVADLEKLPWACDGAVLRADAIDPVDAVITGKCPNLACAFKVESAGVNTTITHVTWAESRTGFWAPTLHFEPVVIDGVRITKCTGHNARNVLDKGLGKGAEVCIARLGDVIPGVVAVYKKGEVSLPPEPHVWTSTRVHLRVVKQDAVEAQALALENSFKVLKLKGVGLAVARQLVAAGVTSLVAFLKSNYTTLVESGFTPGLALRLDWLSQTLAQTVWPRPLLMAASGIFPPGIAVRKMQKVLADPKYLKTSDNAEAVGIRQNWETYLAFEKYFQVKTGWEAKGVVVFTGFRDALLEGMLADAGYALGSTVTAHTLCVFAAPDSMASVKALAAKERKIPLFEVADIGERRASFILGTLQNLQKN